MDLAGLLFDRQKPFTPVRISGGTTNGRILSETEPVVENRLEAIEKSSLLKDVELMRRGLNENIKESGGVIHDANEDGIDDVYKKYKFDQKTQSATQLPVYASKEKILSTIAEYQSVVIQGSTGCGKSTQVREIKFHVTKPICFERAFSQDFA